MAKFVPAKIYPLYTRVLSVPVYVYAYAGGYGALSLLFSFRFCFSAIPKGLSIHHSHSRSHQRDQRRQQRIMWAWYLGCLFAKFKIAKISFWHHFERFAKNCTRENFPLYGNYLLTLVSASDAKKMQAGLWRRASSMTHDVQPSCNIAASYRTAEQVQGRS